MKRFTTFLFLVALGCGNTTPSGNNSNNGTDVGPNNTGYDGGGNGSTGSNQMTNGGGPCEGIGERFITAVRALPRACTTDADCKVASRGQTCDCELAVSSSADTIEFDAVRAELDGAMCANPFGCTEAQCPYRRLSDPGELYAHCGDAGECEVVQVLSCAEFTAKSHGGLVATGGCTDATQCAIRTDLNPCGCGEAFSQNFPFLATQAVTEMIGINKDRCGLDCQGCAPPGNVVCVEGAAETMVCATD